MQSRRQEHDDQRRHFAGKARGQVGEFCREVEKSLIFNELSTLLLFRSAALDDPDAVVAI